VTNTYWADVSEYQVPVDDRYPYQVLAIRSNDGTYRDNKFAGNLAWCKQAVDSGRMAFFIVYLVYRQNWQQDLDTLISDVGTPHPKVVVMIDVESWGGQVTGDQSGPITALRNGIGSWLGSNARVGVYANRGDLTSLYPNLPGDVRVFVAGYGSPIVGYPQEIAQQYTDAGPCAPFGNCDMNVAYGMTPDQVASAFGLTGTGEDMANSDDIMATVKNIESIVANLQNKTEDKTSGTWPVGFDTHARVTALGDQVNAVLAAVQAVLDAVHVIPTTGGVGAAVAVNPADKSAAVAALTSATTTLTDLATQLTK
jgi:hypothetical protein